MGRAPDDYAIRAVPLHAVRLDDCFWAPRLETNRAVTVRSILDKCETTGRVWRFEEAAAVLGGRAPSGQPSPGLPCDDSDVYKIIEAIAHVLAATPDARLEAVVDELVAKIGAAQEPDGYLYTARTMAPDLPVPHPWSGAERWTRDTDLSHELYNLGHLYQAAAAYFRATGKRALLEIAIRTADLLVDTFGPGKRSMWPGHQITEMALVELYRITGHGPYLALARYFLEERAPDGKPRSGQQYNQSHSRILDQTEAVGHAVHATYMYAGIADVAALTGAADYVAMLGRVWNDLVGHKLYVTGSIGAQRVHESFGPADALDNLTAFNETCAAIGLVYWSHRMFLLHGHASAIDVLERALYNGILAGVSLDGVGFFYANPLESFAEHERSAWFECACCPGNLARFLASVPGYQYAHQGSTLFVNLFAAGSARITLDDERLVGLVQQTRYPWDGQVRLTWTRAPPDALTLKLRVPGWAREEPVPSDLYRFLGTAEEQPTLSLNGAPVRLEIQDGYVALERHWRDGDEVLLTLPMPVRRVLAHDRVMADRGRMALQRGPIVYALEGVDHSRGEVLNVAIADDTALEACFRPELLGGMGVISGQAERLCRDRSGRVECERIDFTAIPYCAWANRGPTEMLVWIPRTRSDAWVRPAPTLASTSRVTVSAGSCARAANDQYDPTSSHDESRKNTRLEPDQDGSVWIDYEFPEPARVSEASVYWFEATDWRKEDSPASWRLLYRDGERYLPVRTSDRYGTALDRYHRVRFVPVVTAALRLEAVPKAQSAVGLLEWRVQ
ncbi:MAG: glycoside hydrolase family 127 protein [Polyangiaceae bacterium]|nr:glycoside hydrolase family 127 protein [Polyangiaceae bacterium]